MERLQLCPRCPNTIWVGAGEPPWAIVYVYVARSHKTEGDTRPIITSPPAAKHCRGSLRCLGPSHKHWPAEPPTRELGDGAATHLFRNGRVRS